MQSSNSSNTDADRKALNTEAQSLLKEIDRVAGQTQFNGQNLTDGSFSSGIFQVGANAGQSITIGNLSNARTKSLGVVDVYSSQSANIVTTTGSESITTLDAINAGDLTIKDSNGNETKLGAIAQASTAQERIGQVVEAINNVSAATGVHAYYDAKTTDPNDATKTIQAITLTSDKAFETTGFSDTTTGIAAEALVEDTDNVPSNGLDTLDISSYSGSDLAIRQVDEALNKINSDRAAMGALQSRFESAVTNLADLFGEPERCPQPDPRRGLRVRDGQPDALPDPAAGGRGHALPGELGPAERALFAQRLGGGGRRGGGRPGGPRAEGFRQQRQQS